MPCNLSLMTSAPRGLRLYLSLRLCLCLCPCLSVPTFSIPPPSLSSHETPLHNLKIVTALSIFAGRERGATSHLSFDVGRFPAAGCFSFARTCPLGSPFCPLTSPPIECSTAIEFALGEHQIKVIMKQDILTLLLCLQHGIKRRIQVRIPQFTSTPLIIHLHLHLRSPALNGRSDRSILCIPLRPLTCVGRRGSVARQILSWFWFCLGLCRCSSSNLLLRRVRRRARAEVVQAANDISVNTHAMACGR